MPLYEIGREIFPDTTIDMMTSRPNLSKTKLDLTNALLLDGWKLAGDFMKLFHAIHVPRDTLQSLALRSIAHDVARKSISGPPAMGPGVYDLAISISGPDGRYFAGRGLARFNDALAKYIEAYEKYTENGGNPASSADRALAEHSKEVHDAYGAEGTLVPRRIRGANSKQCAEIFLARWRGRPQVVQTDDPSLSKVML